MNVRNISLKTLKQLRDYVRNNLNQATAPTTSTDFWQDEDIDQQINSQIDNLRDGFYEDAYDFTSLTSLSAQLDYSIPSGFDEDSIHRIELWDDDKSDMLSILMNYRLVDGQIILRDPIGEDGYYFKIEGRRRPYQFPATPLSAFAALGIALSATTTSASATSLEGWPEYGYFRTNQNEFIKFTGRSNNALYGFSRGFQNTIALSTANSSYICACFNGPKEADDLIVLGTTAQLIRNMLANRIMYAEYAAKVNKENGDTIDIMRAADQFEQQYLKKYQLLSKAPRVELLRHER